MSKSRPTQGIDLKKLTPLEQFKEIDSRAAEREMFRSQRDARKNRQKAHRHETIKKAVELVGATAVGGLAVWALSHGNHDPKPATNSEKITEGTQAPSDYKPAPMTLRVKVTQPGGGIYSTVDKEAELGLVKPEHVAEYKQKDLELHNNDPNVKLNESINTLVDQQPTDQQLTKLGE